MTDRDKETKALYLAAWNDLNLIMEDVRAADEEGNVDTVIGGLCAASIFVEELTPFVEKTAVDDRHRDEILVSMNSAIESDSPSSVMRHMDELLNTLAVKHDVFPSSLEEDETVVETVHGMSTKSAGSCRYIHRYRTPLEQSYATHK
jgi:hypothetical protein